MNTCQLLRTAHHVLVLGPGSVHSGGFEVPCAHALCACYTHTALFFLGICDLPHACASHGHSGEHTGSSLRCVMWAGHSGSCVHVCFVWACTCRVPV